MEHCKLFSICPIVSNTSATLGSIHATKCAPGQYISSGARIKIKNIIFPFDLVLIWKEDTQMALQICLFTHMYFPPNFPLNFSPVHQCVHLIGFLISSNSGVIKNPINLIGCYYFVTVLFVSYGSNCLPPTGAC